jgi:hypothetical protein
MKMAHGFGSKNNTKTVHLQSVVARLFELWGCVNILSKVMCF